MADQHEVTKLLDALGEGSEGALEELFAAVYDHLHDIAHGQRARWSGEETLNTTALIHEAYLKLSKAKDPHWRDRGHFFAVTARAIRQILVDRAIRSSRQKRGGDLERKPLEKVALPVMPPQTSARLMALNEALDRLDDYDQRQARVVECLFFAGLGVKETAEAVGVSVSTVERDWRAARVWLYDQVAGDTEPA